MRGSHSNNNNRITTTDNNNGLYSYKIKFNYAMPKDFYLWILLKLFAMIF